MKKVMKIIMRINFSKMFSIEDTKQDDIVINVDGAGGASMEELEKTFAKIDHKHSNYADKDHTHTGYASSTHTHDGYAPVEHKHSEYALKTEVQGGISKAEIVDIIYPVGSIYVSTKNTSPSTLFGGTWKQIVDRFLYCTNSGGEPGGSSTISVANLPSHNHSFTGNTISGEFGIAAGSNSIFNPSIGIVDDDSHVTGIFKKGTQTTDMIRKDTVSSAPNPANLKIEFTPSGTISNTGSGQPFLPPYYTVYAWERTG